MHYNDLIFPIIPRNTGQYNHLPCNNQGFDHCLNVYNECFFFGSARFMSKRGGVF